jgi:hypothetical protein
MNASSVVTSDLTVPWGLQQPGELAIPDRQSRVGYALWSA